MIQKTMMVWSLTCNWTTWSVKSSGPQDISLQTKLGGDRIPAQLFKILKDDATKVLHSMSENQENSAVATGLEKVSFHSNLKEGQCQRMLKLPYSYADIKCQQGNTKNFQMYKLGFEETEESEIKLPTFIGSWRKQGDYRKISTLTSLTTLLPLTMWITIICGKFLKRWKYMTTLLVS